MPKPNVLKAADRSRSSLALLGDNHRDDNDDDDDDEDDDEDDDGEIVIVNNVTFGDYTNTNRSNDVTQEPDTR